MCNVTLKYTQIKKVHHWQHGPVVYGVNMQPSTTLQNSTPKRAEQNPERISEGAIYRGMLARTSSIYLVFEKPLRKPSKDAFKKSSWYKMSLRIYHGHQTPAAQCRQ